MNKEFTMNDAMTQLMRLKREIAGLSGLFPEDSAKMQLSLDLGRFAIDQIRQRDPVKDPPMDGQRVLIWNKCGFTDELVYGDGRYDVISDDTIWDTVPASEIVCWMQMPTKPSALRGDEE